MRVVSWTIILSDLGLLHGCPSLLDAVLIKEGQDAFLVDDLVFAVIEGAFNDLFEVKVLIVDVIDVIIQVLLVFFIDDRVDKVQIEDEFAMGVYESLSFIFGGTTVIFTSRITLADDDLAILDCFRGPFTSY